MWRESRVLMFTLMLPFANSKNSKEPELSEPKLKKRGAANIKKVIT